MDKKEYKRQLDDIQGEQKIVTMRIQELQDRLLQLENMKWALAQCFYEQKA